MDHPEAENKELKREIEMLQKDMADLKRLNELKSKEIIDLTMQKKALKKDVKKRDVDLKEERDANRTTNRILCDQIETLKSQNKAPENEGASIPDLQSQIESLTHQNTLLVEIIQKARDISKEGTSVGIQPSNDDHKNIKAFNDVHENLAHRYISTDTAEKLWENRLRSLPIPTLGVLLQKIYDTSLRKDHVNVCDIRNEIREAQERSEQKVSFYQNIQQY